MVDGFPTIVFLSVLPTIEGRFALPVAVALGVDPVLAFCIVSMATILLAVCLSRALWILDKILRNLPITSGIWEKYVDSSRKKMQKYVDRFGNMGIILFVAVPFPGTGIWTGSIAGYVLGIPPQRLAVNTAIGGILSNALALLSIIGINLVMF